MKTLRFVGALALIPVCTLVCAFGLLCTIPVRLGPMAFSPFGETWFSIYVGVPLFLATLALSWLSYPHRHFTKWVLLLTGIVLICLTIRNFLQFPLAAYTGMYDPYERGHNGCIPASGVCFAFATVFGLTLIAAPIYLYLSQTEGALTTNEGTV